MAVRKLIEQPNPILKAKNKFIQDFSLTKLKKLIKDLSETVKKEKLVGIAAPQIGENYMVFVTYPKRTRYRNFGREDLLRVFINPKFKYLSKEKVIIYEGCGSVRENKGHRFGPVMRSKEVEVEAFNEKGKKFSLRADGILARIMQHEMDHLQGIEFLERMDRKAKLVSETYYKKRIRNSKKQKAASKINILRYKRINVVVEAVPVAY
ncbi:MAG: peptide deformylase [Candidatus Levybacteria bacterium RBG_16_35_11]|nr:MAG: peptide deformylase [Candidatus Levybacteria bacterium RBG_16_35_11]